MNFKEHFNPTTIDSMAVHLERHLPNFDRQGFYEDACRGLETLELKARSNHIAQALAQHLPQPLFPHAAEGIVASLAPETDSASIDPHTDDTGIKGWMIMPLAQTVVLRGLNDVHFEDALELLQELTRRFSSEFAVRHFIQANPERALNTIRTWVESPSFHVRRLASEGTRPRLPWGLRLDVFVRDPSLTLPLLEALRDDPSEYVLRSVANHLNDISKDHPDTVAALAQEWLGAEPSQTRHALVKHACRTLVKKGHKGALSALGFGAPEVHLETLNVHTPTVTLNEEPLSFSVGLRSTGAQEQRLILDYVVHHRKARGNLSPKVFKWKTITLKPGEVFEGTRRHAIRPISTRRYYPGVHKIELQVNGEKMGEDTFTLDCS